MRPPKNQPWPDIPDARRKQMAAIRGRDTKPELLVRRLLHGLGYRYRLHAKGLPGRPDLVFSARRKAMFIHGCFWHGHEHCTAGRIPRTRSDFWGAKLSANKLRDSRVLREIEELGWTTQVLWECELGDPSLAHRLTSFLGATRIEKSNAATRRTD